MNDFSERIIGHYERHASAWAADRGAFEWNDRCWHDRFIEGLPKGASILDLGCGSGHPVARYFVDREFSVTGVDASPTLISICRTQLPNQSWVVGDMRTVSIGKQFDAVLAWDSFFHLKPDDQRNMFAVFAEHAAPSALLMFNSGPAYGEAIGEYRGDPLYHASLSADEYRDLLAKFGFIVISHVIEDPNAGGRTVWMARSQPPT